MEYEVEEEENKQASRDRPMMVGLPFYNSHTLTRSSRWHGGRTGSSSPWGCTTNRWW